jgi:hypothetical protein
VEAARYAAILEAGNKAIADRKADPAGYVTNAFPAVKGLWAQASTDPKAISAAIAQTSLAEKQLGIDKPALLPKAVSDAHAATFNDLTKPQADRVNSIISLVSAAGTDEDRRAVYDQLVKSGVPDYVERAFRALEDGATDPGRAGDARFLFTAASIDPKDLPNNLNVTPAQIDTAVGNVFAPNQIGDVVYNAQNGTEENRQKASTDATLYTRALKLHLADGMGLDAATALTNKEMWGNVQVLTGNGDGTNAGYKITAPAIANPMTYRQGFTALLPEVGHALTDQWDKPLSQMSAADSSLALGKAVRDNYVRDVLQTGYFADLGSGQGYVFINSKTNAFVADSGGIKPMIFTPQEVSQAAASSPQSIRDKMYPGAAQNYSVERMRKIYGSNYMQPLPHPPE